MEHSKKFQNQDLSAIIKRMNENAEFIENEQSKSERLFNGIFSFEGIKQHESEDFNHYQERIS